MAMRIAPPAFHPKSHGAASAGAPSAPGVHDTLRAGLGPVTASTAASASASASDGPANIVSSHPLEARLARWEATQDSLKMEGLRRTFGIAEPVRRGMELKIAREGEWRPAVLGGRGRGVHEDILSGRDADCTWEDVFVAEELRGVAGFHDEVERKVRMQQAL